MAGERPRSSYKDGGSAYAPGERLVQADLASSLRLIAEQGAGGVLRRRDRRSRSSPRSSEAGGHLTLDDLEAYEAVVREPVRGTYRGYEILSMPPPSSGGVHIIQILNMLEACRSASSAPAARTTIHLMAEAMKHAYADRSEYLGDPRLRRRAGRGADLEGLRRGDPRPHQPGPRGAGGRDQARATSRPTRAPQTTHFSVVDQAGNAVANTYTINFGYGSGLVADGTGILLNNELDDFSAKPGVPNAYGLIGGEANAVEPAQAPAQLDVADHRAEGRQAVPGHRHARRLAASSPPTLQVIMNVIDHGMNVAEATLAPRIHHQWLPDELRIEEGLSPDTIRLLEQSGHKVALGRRDGLDPVDHAHRARPLRQLRPAHPGRADPRLLIARLGSRPDKPVRARAEHDGLGGHTHPARSRLFTHPTLPARGEMQAAGHTDCPLPLARWGRRPLPSHTDCPRWGRVGVG